MSDITSDQALLSHGSAVALAQAWHAQGISAENPSVGCAIYDERRRLVGVGHTQTGGRPHAEIMALEMAGARAASGTAFVTLEPCAHHGKSAPCVDALIGADIAHVVILAHDPDPRVSGKGITRLKQAGVAVTIALHETADRQMAGFFTRMRQNRPFVTVKMATSRDGYITGKAGEQTWLTGPVSRAYVHDMRSRADVMLTSSETIITDNPQLDVRIDGYKAAQPTLVILDSKARVPSDAACFAAKRSVLLYHSTTGALADYPSHVETCHVAGAAGGVCLSQVMQDLGKRGLSNIMVEAGAKMFESLSAAGLVDQLIWLRAPHDLHGGVFAWQSVKGMDFSAPASYIKTTAISLGNDDGFILRPNR